MDIEKLFKWLLGLWLVVGLSGIAFLAWVVIKLLEFFSVI